MPLKKMGRPTDSKKDAQISVRFDPETLEKLDAYCKRRKKARPEAIREAVRMLPEKE